MSSGNKKDRIQIIWIVAFPPVICSFIGRYMFSEKLHIREYTSVNLRKS